ncbi:uncharacterized protein [Asterias amurensis]|uniref:uncharacterized protein n=1 Tax=Asterias amurensis TaxID=7602 RepID=UPI003AB46794
MTCEVLNFSKKRYPVLRATVDSRVTFENTTTSPVKSGGNVGVLFDDARLKSAIQLSEAGRPKYCCRELWRFLAADASTMVPKQPAQRTQDDGKPGIRTHTLLIRV